jgi:hypothetical protein
MSIFKEFDKIDKSSSEEVMLIYILISSMKGYPTLTSMQFLKSCATDSQCSLAGI